MKKFFVIGNPISHSLSPELHNFWIKKNKINAVYDKIKLEEKIKEYDDKDECKQIVVEKIYYDVDKFERDQGKDKYYDKYVVLTQNNISTCNDPLIHIRNSNSTNLTLLVLSITIPKTQSTKTQKQGHSWNRT